MISIEQIFEDSPCPTYIRNEQGKIVWANRAYAQLSRSNLTEIIGKETLDFNFALDLDVKVLKDGGECSLEEFYKLEDGSGAWFRTLKKTVIQQNRERFLVSTSVDITSLKEELSVIEKSFANREEEVKELCSEFDAPIQALVGLVKLLNKSNLDKDQRRYIKTILTISEYLLELPKEIMEEPLVRKNPYEKETKIRDITAFVDEYLSTLYSKEDEYNVHVHFYKPLHTFPELEFDNYTLGLILKKLISCIVRYTKTKDIYFTFFQKERVDKTIYLQFSIRNFEANLNPEELVQLFSSDNEKFISNEYANAIEIGLKSAKKMIRLQGGKIWYDHDNSFGGSIEFVLPFLVNHISIQTHESEHRAQDHVAKLSLLFLGSNETIQMLQQQENNGLIRLDVAEDVEEFIPLTEKQTYDLILIEVPEMDDIDISNMIKKCTTVNKYTPVVALIKKEENIYLNRLKNLGFYNILHKPLQIKDVLKLVSETLGKKPNENDVSEFREDGLYDFSGLGNLGKDAEFIKKMQGLFIEIVPDQLKKLESAINLQQWQDVSLIAHSLKSTYGNIKILKAVQAFKRIEDIVKNKTNLEELDYLLENIKNVTDKVIDDFKLKLEI